MFVEKIIFYYAFLNLIYLLFITKTKNNIVLIIKKLILKLKKSRNNN